MNDGSPWTVAVLGPGGVGGLLAALLSKAGHRVICVASPETAGKLRENGLTVRSAQFGDFTARVEADTQLREPAQVCLITVKQTNFAAALERVSPMALGDGLVAPLMNGVEHPAVLRQRYRPELVAPGTFRGETTRVAPGVIEHATPFADVDLASATAEPQRLQAAAEMLAAAGVRARVQEDEAALLWNKLAFLLPLALLTTRYRLTAGGLRTERREELLLLVEEVVAVGQASGAPVDAASVVRFFDGLPPGVRSSMQRDAEAGRPLELDAVGGALLRAASRHGVPAPVAARLVAELSHVS